MTTEKLERAKELQSEIEKLKESADFLDKINARASALGIEKEEKQSLPI